MRFCALAIAFFYAVGTAIGGVAGPWLFGLLIDSGSRMSVFAGYLLGAVGMVVAAMLQWRFERCGGTEIPGRNRNPTRRSRRKSLCDGFETMSGDQDPQQFLSMLRQQLDNYTMLLDVDGTLLDLAPTPREVYVSSELRHMLARLRATDKGGNSVCQRSGDQRT